jgi:type IV pilus assembly protein PilM
MAFPFFDNRDARKREQTVAVDLGGRTTKAVCVQRRNGALALTGYALVDAPVFEKALSPELLTEHLKEVSRALAPRSTKYVTLTLGVNDAVIRQAEMPCMSVADLRQVLKLSPKTFLQQELSGYVFDCHVSNSSQLPKAEGKAKEHAGTPKQKVLVSGARKQLLDNYVAAGKGAGLTIDYVVPGMIGPVNAFEKAMPELFAKEAVALVDLGFRNSFICLVQQGELVLSRVVAIGGDQLTSGLAEALSISYAEAESIKVGMPTEVQSHLDSFVLPLGRELRASIDFFEHQQDRSVTHVFISGGSARSNVILEALQRELLIECKPMSPTSFLQMELPPQQTSDIEQVAPQLTVALGAALVTL